MILSYSAKDETEKFESFANEEESLKLWKSLAPEEQKRIYSWEYCETAGDFCGFLHCYKDLTELLPKDFTIIDIGACQAIQGAYFRDFAGYIAVDAAVPVEVMLHEEGIQHYFMSGQDFIRNVLPQLQKDGLDIRKAFCICSYVPDEELREEIKKVFPYFRCIYTGKEWTESIPELPISKDNPKFIALVQLMGAAAEHGLVGQNPEDKNSILTYKTNLPVEEYGSSEGWISENIHSFAGEMKQFLAHGYKKPFLEMCQAFTEAGFQPEFTESGDFSGFIQTKSKTQDSERSIL